MALLSQLRRDLRFNAEFLQLIQTLKNIAASQYHTLEREKERFADFMNQFTKFFQVVDLVEAPAKSRGQAASEYLALDSGEVPIALVSLVTDAPLAIATAKGVIKRLDPKALPTRYPAEIITVADDDRVIGAVPAPDSASLVMITSTAQLLRTPADKIRPQGRAAGGVAGMRTDGADVLCLARAHDGDLLVVATDNSGLKVTPVMEYPEKGRATAGVRCARLRAGETALIAALIAPAADVLATSEKSALDLPAPTRRDATASPSREQVTFLGLARPRA